jgi:hypothetical protein
VSQDSIEKLARVLKVSPAYLLTGKQEPAHAAMQVLEPAAPKYGSGGLTMADAIRMISEQLGVSEDAVREKISELLRPSDEGTTKKRKG